VSLSILDPPGTAPVTAKLCMRIYANLILGSEFANTRIYFPYVMGVIMISLFLEVMYTELNEK
jgi:hypothetical protein